jgi:hypothetical protein
MLINKVEKQLTAFPNLKRVELMVSKAREIEVIKLPSMTTLLSTLCLSFEDVSIGNPSAEIDVEHMCQTLRETLPTLKNLEALQTDKCLDFLPSKCTSLRALHLIGASLEELSSSETRDWLQQWTNLERLDLPLYSAADDFHIDALEHLTRLTTLSLYADGAEILMALPSELNVLTHLRALCIELPNFGDEDQRSEFEQSDFSDWEEEEEEREHTRDIIPSITWLDFTTECNVPSPASENAISAFLACLPQLKVLRLLNQRTNDRFETEALCADNALGAASLQHVTHLEMLGPWKINKIGPGWAHLSRATSLKSLSVTTNSADGKALLGVLATRSGIDLSIKLRSDPTTLEDVHRDVVSWEKGSCFPGAYGL